MWYNADMKIVDLKTFLSLPEGTVAAKYEPCVFGDLFAKGETWEVSFILTHITNGIDSVDSHDYFLRLNDSHLTGSSVNMSFEESMLDSCFEDGQLFAVWEKEDVEGLIAKLQECLSSAY